MHARIWMRLLVVWVVLAAGSGTAAASQPLMVKISKNAQLVDGGAALLVEAQARCEEGYGVVMNLLFVFQDGAAPITGGPDVVCDGRWHRSTIRVEALDSFSFHSGTARVQADVTVDPGEGNIVTVFLERTVFVRD